MDEIIKLLHFHQEPQANENLTFIDPKHWQFIIEVIPTFIRIYF